MTAASEKDFPEAMREAMADRDLSFRRLAINTGRYRDPAYSPAHLNRLAAGTLSPNVEAMTIVAKALGVKPTYFREYRVHLARQEAERIMAQVGLDEVLRRLRDEP